ncbi:MAG: isoleucine--tRNA ligase [Flavobacteriales bacterium]|nr:isoleucine--tRNA ligase [Flavobacteriales bacterium]
MFPEYQKLDLSKISKEKELAWKKNNVFEKSVKLNPSDKRFVFFEGPPSANGLPGIHHIMARLIKDIFCRYKTLCGYRVDRKAGWDTHGLPVELSVEKELKITKEDIGKKISISDYNKACKKTVMRYTESWNDLTEKMGYWVDTKNPYITYDNKYIESVWFLLKRLFEKKLIYKGYSVQPYSPAAGTGLSSHELNQPGCYKLVKDLSAVVLFKAIDFEKKIKTNLPVFFMAWTTTPWTLFSNTGLAIGKNIAYVGIETINPHTFKEVFLICAENCISSIFDKKTVKKISDFRDDLVDGYRIIERYNGRDLIGLRYEQLLQYVQPYNSPKEAFRVVDADFVNTADGTGLVHLAPTFGSDDFNVAKKRGLPLMLVEDSNKNLVPLVNLKGQFVDGLGEFSGRFVKTEFDNSDQQSVDIDIVVKLKRGGLIFKSEKYEHNYPHCWRTDKPILYYPLDSWFVRSTEYRDRMIEKNNEINWKPKSTGEGRFKNWLENINDWNLSRSRFWGIPLPIWKSVDGSEVICIGSVEELKKLCEESVASGNMQNNPLETFDPNDMSESNYNLFDLHKNYVDNIVLTGSDGSPMYRESEVIDVWFDSGSMPYAQWHYPFENKDLIDSGLFFPADFIAEGVDQTRGWFFTLHAIASMCFNSIAFKNVISNGLVLDRSGQKMSKRLGNTIDPFEAIEAHGADSLRWYMVSNSQPWDNLKFDIDGVVEVKQKMFSTLYNTYSFFSLYANIDGFTKAEEEIKLSDRHLLDQWILSELHTLILSVQTKYESYEPTLACREIQAFVTDKLSNWYIRLCRRRFWKGGYDLEKISAYQTLLECLMTVAKLGSPIAPFFMDQLFCDISIGLGCDSEDSVHLSRFPVANKEFINPFLEEKMKLTKNICSLALSLRKKEGIRVRQPLESVTICLSGNKGSKDVLVELIRSEINVKNVFFEKNSNNIVKRKLVVNFPVVGKKYGKLVKEIVSAVGDLREEDLSDFEASGEISLNLLNSSVVLKSADVFIKADDVPGVLTAKADDVLVVLNSELSSDLLEDGYAREFINFIQNTRRELGLKVMDKITLFVGGDSDAQKIILKHCEYIKKEVLAFEIHVGEGFSKKSHVFEFNDYKLYIVVQFS